MGRVFEVKAFGRWAKKQKIADTVLVKAIDDADNGIVAAELGGDVIKLRVAREAQGKSGGFRTVVAFRKSDRAFFVDGWAKNEKDNINEKDLTALKQIANVLLSLDDKQLGIALNGGAIREIERQTATAADGAKDVHVGEPSVGLEAN